VRGKREAVSVRRIGRPTATPMAIAAERGRPRSSTGKRAGRLLGAYRRLARAGPVVAIVSEAGSGKSRLL
jgi:hypothetical protein